MGIVGPARTFVCCCEEDAEHALRKANGQGSRVVMGGLCQWL